MSLLYGVSATGAAVPMRVGSDGSPAMGAATALPATIGSAASLSDAVDVRGGVVCGIQLPAGWTTAALSFDVSADGSTYTPLYDSAGTEVSIPSASAAASRAFALDPSAFVGWSYVKVRSGLNGAVVAQGGSRVLTLVLRPLA